MLISQSTIGTFDRCKRKWWLEHYRQLGLPSDYRSPVFLGGLVHDALEQYYQGAYGSGGEFLEPIAWVKQQAVAAIEENPDWAEQIAKDAELAGIMVDGYMDWLAETGADAEFAHVEPERIIRAVLIDGVALIGRLDGKVSTNDGWTGILEHKTVQNFTDLPAYAQFNRQLLTYQLLEMLEYLEAGTEPAPAPASGAEVVALRNRRGMPPPLMDGALLNMLRKVKRTASANPPFYARHRVQHNVEELRNHWRHLVSFAMDINLATARLEAGEAHQSVVPPTPTKDCRWSCPFFAICPMFDDGSDVESVIEFEYVHRDPLERYVQEETTPA